MGLYLDIGRHIDVDHRKKENRVKQRNWKVFLNPSKANDMIAGVYISINFREKKGGDWEQWEWESHLGVGEDCFVLVASPAYHC